MGPVASQIVEEPPSLVLLHVEPCQRHELPTMVAGLDLLGLQPKAIALARVDQLQLLDVEPQLVQPGQPCVDPVSLPQFEHLFSRELTPQALVAAGHLAGCLAGVETGAITPDAW